MLKFALRFDYGQDQSIVLFVFAALLEDKPSKLPLLGARKACPEPLEDMEDFLFPLKLFTGFNSGEINDDLPMEGGQ